MIGLAYTLLFLQDQHRRRSNVISTAPVGSVYEHVKTGVQVVKARECPDPQFVECDYIIPNTEIKARCLFKCSDLRLTTTPPSIQHSAQQVAVSTTTGKSDGSSADYYTLPKNASQLQDLISHRNMNAQMGEIFRATYRYGLASHSDQLRDAKKIKFYAEAEIKRLEKLNGSN